MRIAFGLVVFLAACGNSPDMLPVGGGSSGGFPDSGGNSQVDARMIDAKLADAKPLAIDAALFNGRVCLLTDARDFTSCATTGANGLTVHIAGNAAVTAADGTFTIVAGTGAWSVTGSNIVTSYKVKNDYFIPAYTRTMYNSMLTANNIYCGAQLGLCQGEGSVMVNVIHNGAGQSGHTVVAPTQPNPAKYLAFYDNDANATTWNHLSTSTTGSKGDAWLVGFDVGDATFQVDPTGGPTVSAQPVNDQAISWVDVILN